MFKAIRQIYFFCTCPDLSVVWYESLLNRKRDSAETVPGQFELIRLEEIEICFHLADSKSPVSTGGCVAYWEVSNLSILIKRALDLGAEVYRGPIQIHNHQRWMAQIKDPFGNVIGFESNQLS